MKWHKKGTIDFWFSWPEILALILLVIGFILAVSAGSAVITYIVVFFSGLYFGRLWYAYYNSIRTPWFIIIFCFLIGYLLGSFYGSFRVIIVLFILGIFIGFYLHQKKIVKTRGYR